MENDGDEYNSSDQFSLEPEDVVADEDQVASEPIDDHYRQRLTEHLPLGLAADLQRGNLVNEPTYRVKTKNGSELSVHVFHTKNSEGAKIRRFLATDSQGRLVGDIVDNQIVDPQNDQYPAQISGEINVGVKGQGIASAMETAHMDFLQREANELGVPLTRHVLNANKKRLDLAQAAYDLEATDENLAKLNEQIAQQERWQYLYGEAEFLGYRNGEKTFYPEATELGLDQIGEIDLTDPNGEILVTQRDSQTDTQVMDNLNDIFDQILNQ